MSLRQNIGYSNFSQAQSHRSLGVLLQHRFESQRVVSLFFFQAEDGIRDLTVTGVQTCALPIWAMRAEVTGSVLLEQPQYQAAELLIGVITHGYRVAERPATIHKRQVGKSKKGNNVFYGMRFIGVIGGDPGRGAPPPPPGGPRPAA